MLTHVHNVSSNATDWPGGPAAVAIGERELAPKSKAFEGLKLTEADPFSFRFSRTNGFAYHTVDENTQVFDEKMNTELGKYPFLKLTALWTCINYYGPFGGATLQAPRILFGLGLIPDPEGRMWGPSERGLKYFEIQCLKGSTPEESAREVEHKVNEWLDRNPDKSVTALTYQDEYTARTGYAFRCSVALAWEKNEEACLTDRKMRVHHLLEPMAHSPSSFLQAVESQSEETNRLIAEDGDSKLAGFGMRYAVEKPGEAGSQQLRSRMTVFYISEKTDPASDSQSSARFQFKLFPWVGVPCGDGAPNEDVEIMHGPNEWAKENPGYAVRSLKFAYSWDSKVHELQTPRAVVAILAQESKGPDALGNWFGAKFSLSRIAGPTQPAPWDGDQEDMGSSLIVPLIRKLNPGLEPRVAGVQGGEWAAFQNTLLGPRLMMATLSEVMQPDLSNAQFSSSGK